MEDTPERAAWLAGYEAGELDALATLNTPAVRFAAHREMPADRGLWHAWLNGYGRGVHDVGGCIPGHHLSYVFNHETHTGRTELIRER